MPHYTPHSSQRLGERCNVIGTWYHRVLNYFLCEDYNELLANTIAVYDIFFFNLAVGRFVLIFTYYHVYVGTRTCARCLICYIKLLYNYCCIVPLEYLMSLIFKMYKIFLVDF